MRRWVPGVPCSRCDPFVGASRDGEGTRTVPPHPGAWLQPRGSPALQLISTHLSQPHTVMGCSNSSGTGRVEQGSASLAAACYPPGKQMVSD